MKNELLQWLVDDGIVPFDKAVTRFGHDLAWKMAGEIALHRWGAVMADEHGIHSLMSWQAYNSWLTIIITRSNIHKA